jgi:creatinine amidohydrolase
VKRLNYTLLAPAVLLAIGTPGRAQHRSDPSSLVEFELMTWPELKRAIHEQGKTTVLVFNGGTEQRGPQGITAAHTFVARTVGKEIALKLGNAIVAPVLPYSVNNASAELPGTIGISGPLFAAINEEVAEQLIVNGFKNVVLMGDHGGGQRELKEVAQKLDAKYASQGIRVIYCDDVYKKVGADFNRWLVDNGYPIGAHAAIKDTSEMLYLGGDKGWVRKELIPTAVGDPVPQPGEPRDPNAKRINNGISGDARRSSPEIGKRVTEMKVDYAVAQIRRLLGTTTAREK